MVEQKVSENLEGEEYSATKKKRWKAGKCGRCHRPDHLANCQASIKMYRSLSRLFPGEKQANCVHDSISSCGHSRLYASSSSHPPYAFQASFSPRSSPASAARPTSAMVFPKPSSRANPSQRKSPGYLKAARMTMTTRAPEVATAEVLMVARHGTSAARHYSGVTIRWGCGWS